MGLIENLWDETVAGPLPESGLGRLRERNTFNFRSFSGKEDDGGNGRSNGEKTSNLAENAEGMRVTRSITILKSPRSTGDSNSLSSLFSGNKPEFSRRSSSHTDGKSKNNGGAMPPPPPQSV